MKRKQNTPGPSIRLTATTMLVPLALVAGALMPAQNATAVTITDPDDVSTAYTLELQSVSAVAPGEYEWRTLLTNESTGGPDYNLSSFYADFDGFVDGLFINRGGWELDYRTDLDIDGDGVNDEVLHGYSTAPFANLSAGSDLTFGADSAYGTIGLGDIYLTPQGTTPVLGPYEAPTSPPIPEPSTALLGLMGLAAAGVKLYRNGELRQEVRS